MKNNFRKNNLDMSNLKFRQQGEPDKRNNLTSDVPNIIPKSIFNSKGNNILRRDIEESKKMEDIFKNN